MQARVLPCVAVTVVALATVAHLVWAGPGFVRAANTEIAVTCCSDTPATRTINVGDAVTWKPSSFDGFANHPLVSQNGLWRTVSSGEAFTFTFTLPGEYFYYCQFHSMVDRTAQEWQAK